MRYLKNLLFLLLLLSISCEKALQISFSEIHMSSKNNDIVEINIPQAKGKASIINSINSSIENNVISAMQTGDPNEVSPQTIIESINSFVNEYEAFKQDFPDSEQIWETQIDGEVLYQSEDIISIALTAYTNTGGAHGNSKITFLNFNSKNGKLIANTALFSDIAGLKSIAKPYYQSSIEDKNILLNQDEFKLPSNIAYTEEGLVFLYNTFEIAAYSEGIIEFKIPFEEAKPYLIFNNF
ncbi:DUF4163 domain-containing protein [Tamlana sp. 2_MG-2023]|uniref:DUF3298 and DUF4163 domain-containing protein n=1 Tax=unclassified Tamlana TaxID=2614803 RepID=UPI0026E47A63|nr:MULTISPECIES: DUF3298 and DUF4163 domain-containing protein [unclassified Tamlana]MDO6759872.1 DUF4163 domain-containing protein [Tamlana sp. 2_MG-2023]MDO6791958.1 DUF4163 domain-containing protein [Tamlana sp. 1_MG-2023]